MSALCPQRERCGGCRYQGVPYAEQLKQKEAEVRALFAAAELVPERICPIEAAPAEGSYRNRMDYSFGNERVDGPLCLGMHRAGSYMSVLTTDCCQLVHPDFNRILRATLDFCAAKGYSFYHQKKKTGFLRNLVLRRGVRSREILLNLVTSTQDAFDWPGYLELLDALPLENALCGILHTLNDSVADAVLCDELRVIRGRDYYEEEILGLRFRVSAFSFFQTNVEAAERLYREALALIPDLEGKTVYDLYCGTGTITQALAQRAKQAIGVELVEEAVCAARRAAADNGLDNCSFLAGDVLKVLDGIAEQPDVIVVDPPRSGIHPKAWKKILSYGVPQLLYISCNPKTMVQNLQSAADYGYRLGTVKPYDNFPFTKHIESVCLLSHTD